VMECRSVRHKHLHQCAWSP